MACLLQPLFGAMLVESTGYQEVASLVAYGHAYCDTTLRYIEDDAMLLSLYK